MKTKFFLVINERGVLRATKLQPALLFNEVSININLELPDSLFQRPVLSGNIIVGESDVRPTVISPEVTHNIEQAIRQHSGVEVRLSIIEKEGGDRL